MNLDEEILNAMTTCYEQAANYVLLNGTRISETSEVVSKLRAKRCVVDFLGNLCRCCGRQQF
jgi:histidinol-phosphate/aromatic aminotransferase/cobyric acid decarboxylase-like protein